LVGTFPVSALPIFLKNFVVKIDASKVGMGAVLMPEGHPISYFSKDLAHKHQALSAYEKKLRAMLSEI